jgi:amidase
MIHDYWRYDGLAQAELVRAGEVTARELVESAIEASARLNPVLNFICHDLADRARCGRECFQGRALRRCAVPAQGCRCTGTALA